MNFTIKTANQSFFRMFYSTEQETIGKFIFDINHHQWEIPKFRELLGQINTLTPTINTFRIDHTFNLAGKKSLLINGRLIHQKIKKQQVILLAIEDITEHVTAEQIIAERATWFRNMSDNAPVMMWVVDADKVTLFFNKTWLEFSGRSLKQETGVGWLEGVHPDDMVKVIETFNRNFETQTPFEIEYRRRRHDGQYRWLLSISRPTFDMHGEFSGFVGSCTDVHDRKMAELILRDSSDLVHTVLQRLHLMAWMSDPAGKLVFINNWYLKYTGETANQALKTGIFTCLHPDDKKAVGNVWPKHMNTGEPIEMKARILEASTGNYRWHLIKATALHDYENNVTGWVGTNTDIHDQQVFASELEQRVKNRTIALQQANFNLERTNKELQQFTYAASHDLQEPLRKILTFSDRLTRYFGDDLLPKGKQYIARIEESADRMSHLIQALLNFSKITADQLFIPVNLDKSLKKVLKELEKMRADCNATIVSEELPTIEAIPVQIEQLFSNLLTNSLKYSSEGNNPSISIRSRVMRKKEIDKFPQLQLKQPYIEIAITDNGIGFEEEFSELIFNPFQKLGPDSVDGSGMGLSLCMKIAQFHQGHLYAKSKPGEGSVFYILLPEKRKQA
jgi:two-component system CheB/CheR fusion protein